MKEKGEKKKGKKNKKNKRRENRVGGGGWRKKRTHVR